MLKEQFCSIKAKDLSPDRSTDAAAWHMYSSGSSLSRVVVQTQDGYAAPTYVSTISHRPCSAASANTAARARTQTFAISVPAYEVEHLAIAVQAC